MRVCKDCGKTYPSKSELKAHRKAEHKEKRVEKIDLNLVVSREELQRLEVSDLTGSVIPAGPIVNQDEGGYVGCHFMLDIVNNECQDVLL